MKGNSKVKGLFLIVFLLSRKRFRILKGSKEHIIPRNISISEINSEQSEMERVFTNSGAEYFAAVQQKAKKIAAPVKRCDNYGLN